MFVLAFVLLFCFCLGNLSLGQHTGDGKSDGQTFLGRTWMFFLRGVGEGKRKCQDSTAESFSQDDTRFQTVPFLMLYIIYRSVEVSLLHP
jgi:hypothetical protein